MLPYLMLCDVTAYQNSVNVGLPSWRSGAISPSAKPRYGLGAGIFFIGYFGNLAGFVSPYLVGWLKDFTSSAEAGVFAVSTVLVFGAFVVLSVPPKLVNR